MSVVGLAGLVLVFSSPVGPGQDVGDGLESSPCGEEEPAGFGNGDGDQAGCVVFGVSDGGSEDGEESVSHHGEGGPAVPGVPAADLVLV